MKPNSNLTSSLRWAAALALALAMAGCASLKVARPPNVLFSFGGVRFLTPAALSVNMRVEEVPRLVLARLDDRLDAVGPAHLLVTLLGYDVDLLALTGGQVAERRAAHLYFYPTRDPEIEDFARAYPPVAEAANRMHAILQAPFLDVPENVPLLPWTDARPIFQARCHRLRFQNGEGFAFLTRYGGPPGEIGQEAVEDLEYVFQGQTDDGLVYVSALFPVRAPKPLESPGSPATPEAAADTVAPLEYLGLGETPPPPLENLGPGETASLQSGNPNPGEAIPPMEGTAAPSEAETRLREEVVNREVLSPADFTPSLDTLDSLFRSIVVDLTEP